MPQRCIKKHLTKSKKSKKCIKSIAKECNNSRNYKPQDSVEECLLQTTSLQLKETFHPIQINKYLNKIHAPNLMKIKIMGNILMALRIQFKKIFSVRCFLTRKNKTIKLKPMHSAAFKWDKVVYYRVKTYLTSENYLYLIL